MNDKENARTAAAGNASPAGKKGYRIALAGNPNCGKTTLFNAYTGSRQHVGNYPGVTVDRKEGTISVDNTPVTLVDLPGTYSLTAYSQEELVARDELSLGRVDAVIDCADASALERNMLLTVQMMEMGMPVVLACNMMDEARKAGIHIDMQKLSEQLGTPVLPIVARNGEGIREVARAALDLAKKGRKEPLHINYGPELTEAVEALEKRLSEEKILIDRYHPHWTALKLLEGDTKVQESVREARPDLAPEILSYCEGIEEKVKAATQATCESVITDARYGYIRGLLAQGVVKQDPGKDRLALSDRLDKILTNRFLGPLIMIGVLYLMFVITFNLGAYPQEWLEDFFAWMGSELGDHMDDGLLKSLICDGIIAGVGGVVSFVPLIAIMFALIAFIEDSGYMARIAYMMDRIFRFFGLHGASVMPYIIAGGIAGGCAIPGVMATRTLRSPKEKLATLLTLPFMCCGAKVPCFLLLIAAFFPKSPALAFFLVLCCGWVGALLMASLLRHTIIRGAGTPFVMELPPYRLPTIFSILMHMWERTWMYLKKAGTIILAISIVIWAAMTFPSLPDSQKAPFEEKVAALEGQQKGLQEDSEQYKALQDQIDEANNDLAAAQLRYSYGGRIGVAIEPVTKYLGFTWRTNIALVAGVAAKEAVVSTLGTAYSMGEQDPEDAAPLGERLKQDPDFTPAVALSLMIFILFYSPCFVSLVVIKSEAGGWRWLFFSMIVDTIFAAILAFIAYNIGRFVWGC
ncbi:MAG: ferrous iron transport protein B [Desulfovibrio sp.]|mgnify:FL=1|nr:ferrous iron transport protein B [Desulfovibrio sp.]